MDSAAIDKSKITQLLANFVVNSKPDDIPEHVYTEATRSFLNWAGCAVGGSIHLTLDRTLAAIRPFAGEGQATVLGRGEKLDLLHAALLNGISSHVFDFDDTHLRTIIHPAGPIASALLPLAETRPMTGREFLHAFILGVEVECRIGNSVYPEHYDRGWHITGTAGVFGAAAAAGKILGLNAQQMTWALGIAATQSSGLREMFGTMCKPFHPGRAAQNGLLAAHLAAQNFTSSDRGIEAPRGFAHVLSTKFDPAEITEKLGDTWEISLNTYKPFACGIVIHPALDGCIQLRNAHGLKAENIASIDLKVHPLVLELTGKTEPRTGLEGKFSVYHSCAAAIVYGRCGEHEYADEVVIDPQIVALRRKVRAEAEKGIHEDQVRVAITTTDGKVHELFVEHAIGSLDRPLSDEELDHKVRDLCEPVLGASGADRFIALCRNVANSSTLASIIEAGIPTR
ncbi:MmgE/PrpD family protein [Microvirga sp. BT689]|uniref:MmgE/PrpD family protein n=1 Tax=Microvirga arvi TaxID=2778731 RepID=UPI0019529468|nr:MmgE/PrpD family protein [Microvirga arvi]MBM6583688.1 MmgE/PrpD family protein [Microvirga arvi]